MKQRDPNTGERSLLFQLAFPGISSDVQPRHRFMSTFEQRVEKRDETVQYLIVAAEPYETVAFKIPNQPIDRSPERFFTHWDEDTHFFYIQFYFLAEKKTTEEGKGAAENEEGEEEQNYEIEEEEEGEVEA